MKKFVAHLRARIEANRAASAALNARLVEADFDIERRSTTPRRIPGAMTADLVMLDRPSRIVGGPIRLDLPPTATYYGRTK